ncbi:hypothetical protein PCO31111_02951 [Pandoraea communis]|uniref:Uncharacterized protein n=1 Tax=Pandoraea communis TaxID=2508297 RepID=A0A5E4VWW8_9BURK|nr:hypothetical protein [Pandoraea communis]VVE16888.1 hypothetical protein PCO31111_02951 [Pandoraea communis]
MIQPYILHYDLAWLLLPIVYLYHDRATRDAWTNRERAIVCLAWCLPLLSPLPSHFPAILQPGVLVLPALFVVMIAPPISRAFRPSVSMDTSTEMSINSEVTETRVSAKLR